MMQSKLFTLWFIEHHRKAPNVVPEHPALEVGEYGQGFFLGEPSDSLSDGFEDARKFVKPCNAESCDADAMGAGHGGGGGSPFLE